MGCPEINMSFSTLLQKTITFLALTLLIAIKAITVNTS